MEVSLYFYMKSSPHIFICPDFLITFKENKMKYSFQHSSTSFTLICNNLVNYSAQVFKKSNVTSFEWKKNKKLKSEKNRYFNKSKN